MRVYLRLSFKYALVVLLTSKRFINYFRESRKSLHRGVDVSILYNFTIVNTFCRFYLCLDLIFSFFKN